MTRFKWQVVVCQIPLSLLAEVDVDRHRSLRRVDWSEQAQQTDRNWNLVGYTRTTLQADLQLSAFAVISVRVDSLSRWYTNLTTRQQWLVSFSGGSVSQSRHRACGYLMAVADATRLYYLHALMTLPHGHTQTDRQNHGGGSTLYSRDRVGVSNDPKMYALMSNTCVYCRVGDTGLSIPNSLDINTFVGLYVCRSLAKTTIGTFY